MIGQQVSDALNQFQQELRRDVDGWPIGPDVSEILELPVVHQSISKASELFWRLEWNFSNREYLLLLVWALRLLASVGPALRNEAFCSNMFDYPARNSSFKYGRHNPLELLTHHQLKKLKQLAQEVLERNVLEISDKLGMFSSDDVFEVEIKRLIQAIDSQISSTQG